MKELYRGHHIFLAQDHDMREVVVPILFPFDQVEMAKSAHGCSPGFANREPKFIVTLSNGNKFWLMGRFTEFAHLWDQYLAGDNEPCDCPECQAAAEAHQPTNQN